MIVGYGCSPAEQDLTAQRQQLLALGVDEARINVDHGLSGKNRDRRPGLRQALSAVRPGDTLLESRLDRLARSVPDARAIADELAAGSQTRRTFCRPSRPNLSKKMTTDNARCRRRTRSAEFSRS